MNFHKICQLNDNETVEIKCNKAVNVKMKR